MTHGPHGPRLPYLPALDGLRGVAVLAVLLFHAGVPFVRGGHLGVTVFFTLSGFLITALLLNERHAMGRIDLRAFWIRRARRLLPATLVCFALIAVLLRVSNSPPSPSLVGDAFASATWTANWRFVLDEQTYADLFSQASLFQHFWSLAIEEQFYLVFPLLAVGILGVRRARPATGRLALVLGSLIALSTWQLARLYAANGALGHAYYGTDARMAELLVGALLAVALVRPTQLRTFHGWASRLVSLLGVVGLVGVLLSLALVEKGSPGLYRGGLLAVALGTAAMIASVVQGGPVARVLAQRPLVLLGLVSYGLYLFHWPLFVVLSEFSTGLSAPEVFTARFAITLAVAVASYRWIEVPVRRQVTRRQTGPALVGWGAGLTVCLAALVLAGGTLVVADQPEPVDQVQASGPAPAAAAPVPGSSAPARVRAHGGPPVVLQSAVGRPAGPITSAGPSAVPDRQPPSAGPARTSIPEGLVADPKKSAVPPVPAARDGALRVVVVGDSVGVNVGTGLLAWAAERDDVVVYNLAVPACPLSRGGERRLGPDRPFPVDPVCAWWDDPSSERRQAFEQFVPDVVVVQDGVNEVFDRKLESWQNWRGPKDLGFQQWLVDEYTRAIELWKGQGAEVLMTNSPCADWKRYEHFAGVSNPELRVSSLNTGVYNRLTGVTKADLFQRVCPNGQYSDEVEGIADGRPDGFHFSADASAALARNWLGPLVLQASRGSLLG